MSSTRVVGQRPPATRKEAQGWVSLKVSLVRAPAGVVAVLLVAADPELALVTGGHVGAARLGDVAADGLVREGVALGLPVAKVAGLEVEVEDVAVLGDGPDRGGEDAGARGGEGERGDNEGRIHGDGCRMPCADATGKACIRGAGDVRFRSTSSRDVPGLCVLRALETPSPWTVGLGGLAVPKPRALGRTQAHPTKKRRGTRLGVRKAFGGRDSMPRPTHDPASGQGLAPEGWR